MSIPHHCHRRITGVQGTAFSPVHATSTLVVWDATEAAGLLTRSTSVTSRRSRLQTMCPKVLHSKVVSRMPCEHVTEVTEIWKYTKMNCLHQDKRILVYMDMLSAIMFQQLLEWGINNGLWFTMILFLKSYSKHFKTWKITQVNTRFFSRSLWVQYHGTALS